MSKLTLLALCFRQLVLSSQGRRGRCQLYRLRSGRRGQRRRAQVQHRSLQDLLLNGRLLRGARRPICTHPFVLEKPFAASNPVVLLDLRCFGNLARLVVAQVANTSLDTSGTWSILYAIGMSQSVLICQVEVVRQAPIQSEVLPGRMSYAVVGAKGPESASRIHKTKL